jgi:hypothetical protein
VDVISVPMGNGYKAQSWHGYAGACGKKFLAKHTKAFAGGPLFWTRRPPDKQEAYSEWKKRTNNDSYLGKVETITKMLFDVLVRELTAEHMPLFVFQWGVLPGRLALQLFPFKSDRVVCLDDVVRQFFKVDGRYTVNSGRCSSVSNGITLRWLGTNESAPSMWANLPHACMSPDVSSYGLRGIQVALAADERKKISKWAGSATQKHFETVLFHLACVEFVLIFMLPNADQAQETHRTAAQHVLRSLLTRIGESRIFTLHETPIELASLVATVPPPRAGGGGQEQEAGAPLRSSHGPGILTTLYF